MDTFIVYHEVLMSLTTRMHRETPLNAEAVAIEVATNLESLGALMGSNSHSSGLAMPVCTNDAATQCEGVDISQPDKERPVCVVTPLEFSEKFTIKPATSNSVVPSANGHQNSVAAPTSPVPGPSGIQTSDNTQTSEVDSLYSNSPLSYNSYEMISDSDSDT